MHISRKMRMKNRFRGVRKNFIFFGQPEKAAKDAAFSVSILWQYLIVSGLVDGINFRHDVGVEESDQISQDNIWVSDA